MNEESEFFAFVSKHRWTILLVLALIYLLLLRAEQRESERIVHVQVHHLPAMPDMPANG